MSDELLPAVVSEPSVPATGSVIWLHGLGADGHDFEPVLPRLPLSSAGVRVILPHAPAIPVTLNGGMVMPAWYDIAGLDLESRQDEKGIRESAGRIEDWIAAEKARGIPSERIALVGFSQGGALAVYTALRHPERLAGLAGLSTYLLLEDRLEAEASEANKDLPVFQGHGSMDPIVRMEWGEATRDRLKAAGHSVEWHDYPMEHQVCDDEIRDLAAWLAKIFG